MIARQSNRQNSATLRNQVLRNTLVGGQLSGLFCIDGRFSRPVLSAAEGVPSAEPAVEFFSRLSPQFLIDVHEGIGNRGTPRCGSELVMVRIPSG
jgi:hypothetical protein